MSEGRSTVGTRIADWACGVTYDQLPGELVHSAENFILDVLGVGLAAVDAEVAVALRRWAATRQHGDATALSVPQGLGADDAAFVNGSIMHSLDFDDMSFGGHASSCILPAILGAGEAHKLSGHQVLTAYCVAMEVFGRQSFNTTVEAIHEYGWHPTSVFGVPAAAVGAALALRLSPEQTAHALAIAASSGAGVTSNFGSLVKPVHAGSAAAAGVRAAQLAAAGITGSRTALEAPQGYGSAYTRDELDWERMVEQLGDPYRMTFKGPSIKQYPCCGGNHRMIENLRTIMREHSLGVDDVRQVVVHVDPHLLTILRYDWPSTPYEAKFCAAFSLSATLARGTCDLPAYTEEFLASPELAAARRKVTVLPDLRGPREHVRVEVTDDAGTVHVGNDDVLPGSPLRPMPREGVVAKFETNAAYAVDRDTAAELRDAVFDLSADGVGLWPALAKLAGPTRRG